MTPISSAADQFTHLKPTDFHYDLPPERIAQFPLEPRDSSRLLVLDRNSGSLHHHHFSDLADLLTPNDILVRNNTKVIPARIFGTKQTGGKAEILLIRAISLQPDGDVWECLTKPGLKLGQTVTFGESSSLSATCVEIHEYTRYLKFSCTSQTFWNKLNTLGHTPIPPYIHWNTDDEKRLREVYQTTYAKITGSVAAPTAGLHFTTELDTKLRQKGVEILEVTLHVGLGTFLPVQDAQLANGELHQEFCEITPEVAAAITAAKVAGKRIIAVGTTTVRTVESAARVSTDGTLSAFAGPTTLFIRPGFPFKIVDSMVTNFHLPDSSLLMLLSAFVSAPNTAHPFENFAKSTVGRAYDSAIQEQYRFFSFGDAMWIK
jgi:S-adenosylmethionine:tRNA ribosyltransferase-isomerase